MTHDLTKDQCEHILSENHYAHLACVDGDEPYLLPITYVYEDGCLYGVTEQGRKIDVMRKNPRVCVQVEHVESAETWQSVICWGKFEEVTDANDVQRIKLLMAEEHGKGILVHGKRIVSPLIEHLRSHSAQDAHADVVYRIKPERMTGRRG